MKNRIIKEDCNRIIETFDTSLLSGKTFLITGASGLIGTYFLYSLKEMLESQKIKNISVYAVIHSKLPKHFEEFNNGNNTWIKFITADLTNLNEVNEIPNADYIIHAACYGQPGRFMSNPTKTIALNTIATQNLLEHLNANGKFLFISTSAVYSGSTEYPYKETCIGNTTPMHPRACYIEGKRCGEAIVNAARQNGIDAKSARVSLAYGPGIKSGDKRVLYNFIQKGFKGKIELLDSGVAMRTYCYVCDTTEILWKILLYGKEPVYNVGGTSHISIRDLATLVGEIMNVPVVVPKIENTMLDAPENDCVDISLATSLCSKTKWISIQEGVKRTIEWMKSNEIDTSN